MQAQSGQYLTLRLGSEEYAIDIQRVRELRFYEEPTRMVNSPAFNKGVVDLRGVIVPIADLRLKLQMDKVEYTDFTVVIILNIQGTVVGAVVDSVADVLTIEADAIKPAPQFYSVMDARFVVGLVTQGERTLIVMDVDALMSNAELGMVV